jgi:hypothetical protein
VKLLARDGELYILARSQGRWQKEGAMRRRRLKSLWKRLQELQAQELERDQLLLKLGAAKAEAGATMAWWKCRCRSRNSRLTRKPSSFVGARTNSGKPCAGKAVICCAPICPQKNRPCCGNTRCSSPRSQ